MANHAVQLDLSREQLWQWYGHIFVYMACHALQTGKPVPRRHLEAIQDLGIRLFALCQQEHDRVSVQLTEEEVEAVQRLLEVVQVEYENSPASEHRSMALAHLFSCRALLRAALQQEHEGRSP